MSTKIHRACYGKIIPDFGHLNYNKPTEGKAFQVFVEKIGIGTQRRGLEIKSVACRSGGNCTVWPTVQFKALKSLSRTDTDSYFLRFVMKNDKTKQSYFVP